MAFKISCAHIAKPSQDIHESMFGLTDPTTRNKTTQPIPEANVANVSRIKRASTYVYFKINMFITEQIFTEFRFIHSEIPQKSPIDVFSIPTVIRRKLFSPIMHSLISMRGIFPHSGGQIWSFRLGIIPSLKLQIDMMSIQIMLDVFYESVK